MNVATERKALMRQVSEVEDLALIQAIKNLLTPTEKGKINDRPSLKHTLAYAPEVIEINNRKYTLNYRLRCLFEKEEGHFVIKNELLDIYAVGDNEAETERDFSEEFDYLYRTLNGLENDKMTARLQKIKLFINHYVKSVSDGNR